MARRLNVKVAGRATLAPAREIPLPLEEMIYTVTSAALADADLDIQDVDGACMAASDLHDGRAISTMTLTGSTGSFHKTEMRMCNDSLSAVIFGAAEIASGAAKALIVCSWTKFSDAEPDQIAPLSMEPVYHRALGFHPDAIARLWESRDCGAPTITATSLVTTGDVAAAIVITAETSAAPSLASLVGYGGSMGSYLIPATPFLQPVREAADRACENAGTSLDAVPRILVAGMHDIDDAEIVRALDVPGARVARLGSGRVDLGYAAGLTALIEELDTDFSGPALIVSAGGAGRQNTYAIVLEKA